MPIGPGALVELTRFCVMQNLAQVIVADLPCELLHILESTKVHHLSNYAGRSPNGLSGRLPPDVLAGKTHQQIGIGLHRGCSPAINYRKTIGLWRCAVKRRTTRRAILRAFGNGSTWSAVWLARPRSCSESSTSSASAIPSSARSSSPRRSWAMIERYRAPAMRRGLRVAGRAHPRQPRLDRFGRHGAGRATGQPASGATSIAWPAQFS